MKSSILVFGIVASLFALSHCLAGEAQTESSATFTDPVPYCQTVGTIDAADARYKGPRVTDWMLSALYSPDEITAQKGSGIDPGRAIVWRCMNGAVLACVQSNSPICGKANQDKRPTKPMRDYCASEPNADVIPLSVIGHENPTVFDWACHDKEPIIMRQIFTVDAKGFPSELWKQIAPDVSRGGPLPGAAGGGGNDKSDEMIVGGKPSGSEVPTFPWPPPAASASYVLPDHLLKNYSTLGDVSGAIISALEHNGYVERSFFQTEAGGVALVTRLERINDDGTPVGESERWPTSKQDFASGIDLVLFLQGLFFVDPGHYRVIVFILQDLPFSQSAATITAAEARAWLRSGANVLPPALAERPFSGGHCTVLIYEFASDGTTVHLVESHLTGKQHLETTGLLAGLESAEHAKESVH